MTICNLNIVIHFHQWAGYKTRNLWCHVTWRTWLYTQLVSCELFPESLLGLSSLEGIHAIDTFIFCDAFWYVLLSDILSNFFDLYARVLCFYVFQWTLFYEVSGLRKMVIQWCYDTHLKHLFGFWLLSLVPLLLEFHKLNGDFLLPLSFPCCLKHFSFGCDPTQWLHLDWEIFFSLHNYYWIVQIKAINLQGMHL